MDAVHQNTRLVNVFKTIPTLNIAFVANGVKRMNALQRAESQPITGNVKVETLNARVVGSLDRHGHSHTVHQLVLTVVLALLGLLLESRTCRTVARGP